MTNVVNDVVGATGKAVNQAANAVGNVITTALENPIQIIEVVAVTLVFGPEGLALSETLGSVGAAAVSNAAVAAMNGASVENVARAAVGGAAGAYVSGAVATSIGSPPAPGEPPVPGQPPVPGAPPAPPAPPTPPVLSPTQTALLANIAGSAAGSGVQTAIMGGNASQIFQNMGAGALAAGASAGATALGASPTLANTLGGFVGGRTQAGGTTLSGLAGAAGGAARTGTVIPQTETVAQTEVPIIDLSQGTQVAGPGGVDPRGFQPGTVTQTATGLFTTYTSADGTIVNIPITVNQNTGEIKTTSTDPEALKAVKLLKVDSTRVNPVFLDRTPISPNLTAAEQADLAKVTSNDMTNALRAGKSIDEYYNSYAYAQALPVFASQIAQELANDPTGIDPTYNNMRAEYKKITGTDFASSRGMTDIGTVNVSGLPVTDLGSIIITAKVISYDPSTQVAFIYSPDGTQQAVRSSTELTPGNTVAVNTQTSQVIPTSVTTQTPADITSTTPTTRTTTPATLAAPKTPEFPTATTTPTTGVDTFVPVTPTTPPRPPTTTTPSTPRVPGQPPTPSAPAAPAAPPVQISDRPSTSPITPTSTALGTTPTPGASPTGPSTEKTKFPEFKPETFVYSNVPKTLRGSPFAQQQLPTTGQTVSLGGGAGGVNVESGQPQQAKWNIASLKLKEEAEGTPDYGALSSALGI